DGSHGGGSHLRFGRRSGRSIRLGRYQEILDLREKTTQKILPGVELVIRRPQWPSKRNLVKIGLAGKLKAGVIRRQPFGAGPPSVEHPLRSVFDASWLNGNLPEGMLSLSAIDDRDRGTVA